MGAAANFLRCAPNCGCTPRRCRARKHATCKCGVLAAAKNDPTLEEAMTKAAIEADTELVKPLFSSATSDCNFRAAGARS